MRRALASTLFSAPSAVSAILSAIGKSPVSVYTSAAVAKCSAVTFTNLPANNIF